MQAITGSGRLTLPGLQVAPVTPAAAYFGGGQSFIEGVRALINVSPVPAVSLTFLAGQAVECYLKAFLASAGIDERRLSRAPYGHDLLRLWRRAADAGSAIDRDPPDWVQQLGPLHGYPFRLRYPMGLHGLVLPNPVLLASALSDLASKVRPVVG